MAIIPPDNNQPQQPDQQQPGPINFGGNTPPKKTGALPPAKKQAQRSPYGVSEPPQITIKDLPQPDTSVNAEACLEEMHRVLLQLAEKQEEPEWVQQHVLLAEQWRAAAEMLLKHRVESHQVVGDAELKQQQLHQQHELHQQTLMFNDQKNDQNLKQTDDQHKQKMKQGDQNHALGLRQRAAAAKKPSNPQKR